MSRRDRGESTNSSSRAQPRRRRRYRRRQIGEPVRRARRRGFASALNGDVNRVRVLQGALARRVLPLVKIGLGLNTRVPPNNTSAFLQSGLSKPLAVIVTRLPSVRVVGDTEVTVGVGKAVADPANNAPNTSSIPLTPTTDRANEHPQSPSRAAPTLCSPAVGHTQIRTRTRMSRRSPRGALESHEIPRLSHRLRPWIFSLAWLRLRSRNGSVTNH